MKMDIPPKSDDQIKAEEKVAKKELEVINQESALKEKLVSVYMLGKKEGKSDEDIASILGVSMEEIKSINNEVVVSSNEANVVNTPIKKVDEPKAINLDTELDSTSVQGNADLYNAQKAIDEHKEMSNYFKKNDKEAQKIWKKADEERDFLMKKAEAPVLQNVQPIKTPDIKNTANVVPENKTEPVKSPDKTPVTVDNSKKGELENKKVEAMKAGDYEMAQAYQDEINRTIQREKKAEEEKMMLEKNANDDRVNDIKWDMAEKMMAQVENMNPSLKTETKKSTLNPKTIIDQAYVDKLQERLKNAKTTEERNKVLDDVREAKATHEKQKTEQKAKIETEMNSPEQKKVDALREVYIKEYKKCKDEIKRQLLIERTKIAATNILSGVKNLFSKEKTEKKVFKEEDYFTDKYRETKKAYDQARVEMGSALFNTRKAELEKEGLSGEELEKALIQYKATEILNRTIINERQKLVDAKAEGVPINKALWKTILDGYMSIKPKAARVALSTLLFLPVAAGGATGAALIGGYGVLGYGALFGLKFTASMAIGAISANAVKGIDVIKRKKDAEFKENTDKKWADLRDKFASGQITQEEFEKESDKIGAEEKARMRDRMILKGAAGIAIAGIAGAAAYSEMSHVFGNHAIPSVPHDNLPINKSGSGIWGDKLPPQQGEGIPAVKPGIWTEKAPWDGVGKAPNPEGVINMNEAAHKIIEVKIDGGHGAIKTFEELQNNLKTEYPDISKAPASVQHILGSNPTKLAEEFNMYKPGQIDESALIPAGSTMRVDGFGNLIYHNAQTGENNILAGTITRDANMIQSGEYTGKMFDANHAEKINTGTSSSGTSNINNGSFRPASGSNIMEGKSGGPSAPLEASEGYTGTPENFNKVFPDTEKIQGMTRHDYDMEVSRHLEEKGVKWGQLEGDEGPFTWSDQAARQRDLWKWEKFGQVIRQEAAQSADGKIHLNFSDPESNPAWHAATATNAPASALMDSAHDSPQYIVGKELVSLRESVNAQTGDFINPNPGESADNYALRLMKHLDGQDKVAPSVNIDSVPTGKGSTQIIENKINSGEAIRSSVKTESLVNDPNHFASAKELANKNVIIEKPEGVAIHKIKWENWNKASDNTLKESNVPASEYWKERELQQLFGHAEQKVEYVESLGKNAQVIKMDYFRNMDSWNDAKKIPAKYFFNLSNSEGLDKMAPAELSKLIKDGLITDNIVKTPSGEAIHNYAFVNRSELMRLSHEYAKIDPLNARPINNETMEQYIGRVTKEVHQADDGTFWAKNPNVTPVKSVVDSNIENTKLPKNIKINTIKVNEVKVPTQNTAETVAPKVATGNTQVSGASTNRGGYNTGGVENISPTRGVYNTGGDGTIYPRGAATGTQGGGMSTPVPMTRGAGGVFETGAGGQYGGYPSLGQQAANILIQEALRRLGLGGGIRY